VQVAEEAQAAEGKAARAVEAVSATRVALVQAVEVGPSVIQAAPVAREQALETG
jgi:hypothetical protein